MKVSVENRSYCATVVKAETFVDLEKCDNVKGCLLFGNQVIVSKSLPAGTLGLFFPIETEIMPVFLGANNLYRKTEFGNVDLDAKGGFFEQSGRVKCMKFRGHRSEGFFLPLDDIKGCDLQFLLIGEGVEFDTVNDIQICRKYIPRHQRGGLGGKPGKPGVKRFRKEDLIVNGQFRFHYDTAQLARNIHKLDADTQISITDKWHGTSVVIGRLITKRTLNWFERLLIKVGVRIQDQEYGMVAASRTVVKSVAGEAAPDKNHYYGTDLWSLVAQEVADRIPQGFTIYGEIVGYTPNGAFIQKGYTYRCAVGEHRLLVYRVTFTNEAGIVFELGWAQLKQFCQAYGLEHVIELWTGRVCDFIGERVGYAVGSESTDFRTVFLDLLTEEYLEKNCAYNDKLPAEGVVIRVDRLQESEAYKLKSFKFKERETKMIDEGAEDLETSEETAAVEENQ